MGGAAARPVPLVLGAGQRADVLQVAEHAVAAGLAAERGLLERELEPLDGAGQAARPVDRAEDPAEALPEPRLAADREEAAERVEDERDRLAARAARPRGLPVQVEAVGPAEPELRRELLPTRREHVAPRDEAGDQLGVLSAADVGAGVAEPPQHGDRPRRTLEPGAEAAVGGGALALDERQELGRDPAAGRLAARHLRGRPWAEQVDVADEGQPEPALVDPALELPELLGVPADLGDRVVGARPGLLLELQVLVDAVGLEVLEGRDGDGHVERRARPTQAGDQRDELDGVDVVDGRGPVLADGRRRPVARHREDVLDAERRRVFEQLAEAVPVEADAGDVEARGEAARAGGGADAEGVVPGGAAGVGGDAARDDAGHPRQPGGDLEQPRLAGEPARHQLDQVAEAPRRERRPERVRARHERSWFPRPSRPASGTRPRPAGGAARSRG